jgi:hypothetical protein
VFPHPDSPQFLELSRAISVVTHALGPPIDGYSEFMDQILAKGHPQAAVYYCDFVQLLLKNDMDEDRKSDAILQQIQVLQKIWTCDPTVENCERLAGALRQPCEGFEAGFMLLGKLAMLDVSLLGLLVLIKKFVEKSNEEGLEGCKKWYESVVDSYGEGIKGKCIGMVLEGKGLEVVDTLSEYRC